MKTGKNTGTRQNAISATKVCTKTSISTRWRFLILIQENTAAKATEDATIRRQTTDIYAPREIRKPKDAIDQWIANNQETCLFCADPLLVPNFKDSVKDHDHVTGKYRGAAHNECNFKLKLNRKTTPIPVFFHNLKVRGAVTSWLVRSTPERAVRVRALAGDSVLCSWARHFTLTVPLSTLVHKWVPAICWRNLTKLRGSDLRWTSILSRGSRNTSSRFMLQKPG